MRMQLHLPRRDVLLAKLPLYCPVRPLQRPRARNWGKGVYQPLENQQELLAATAAFEPLYIDIPCCVDIVVNQKWSVSPSGKRKSPPHPAGRKSGDIDNLAKAVNDALVKAKIIVDDTYIVGQHILRAYGPEDAAAILIYSVCDQTEEIDVWPSNSALTSVKQSEEPFPIFQKDGEL